MFKKFTMISLIGLMLNVSIFQSNIYASTTETKLVEKIKTGIRKLGTGESSKIRVKLLDKTEIKGYISEITNEDFSVISQENNSPVKIPYPQVKQVKGHNLSTGAKIAIGIGVFLLVLLIIGIATGGNINVV